MITCSRWRLEPADGRAFPKFDTRGHLLAAAVAAVALALLLGVAGPAGWGHMHTMMAAMTTTWAAASDHTQRYRVGSPATGDARLLSKPPRMR
jgi:hypothetical protein